ncbi:MAG: hypothetical protein D8H93_08150 [Capnocytophaga sp.]|nr:MAG: hypothetical protein D8H93_08150 [Capnocytophaga sp.]
MFERIEEIKAYIHVSKYLDIQILKPYIDTAISERVRPLIGEVIWEKLSDDSFVMPRKAEIYEGVKKAVANYAIAYSIPFVKMHLSSTGANAYQDNKMERSPWWDVRDYGLNAVRIGDHALNGAVALLSTSSLGAELPFAREVAGSLFGSPRELSELYSIGDSYEIFLRLLPLMRDIWELYIAPQLSPCVLSDIRGDETALGLLRKIVGYYTLADAVFMQGLTYTTSGIVLQWEQLPWQKSMLLSDTQLKALKEGFLERAQRYRDLLLQYIKAHPALFPCYQGEPLVLREPVAKKSGLYF